MDCLGEGKRHIDCDWLMKIKEGVYKCCDIRSTQQGKELSKEEVMQQACQFLHLKTKNTAEQNSEK